MKSHSVEICPFDHRCRYWAKIIRVDEALPQPVNVAGATDIPGPYLKIGDEELLPGDVLFEGESNHHRRTDRGWTYWISIALGSGKLLAIPSGFSAQKTQMKRQGMAPELLKGSGDIAAMVRIAHGIRNGLVVTKTGEP
ncbi:hypothetical protein [Eoetvoesiella caeni]